MCEIELLCKKISTKKSAKTNRPFFGWGELAAFPQLPCVEAPNMIGVEGFKLAPKQDSLIRNDQGKNHILLSSCK
jgi:hypothetical protein